MYWSSVLKCTFTPRFLRFLMQRRTHDLRINGQEDLPSPDELSKDYPLSKSQQQIVTEARDVAGDILRRRSSRLLVVVGPCSIHDTKAALEYAAWLKSMYDEYKEWLCPIMRVYFEKPRTTVGWKGLINDPDLDGSFKIRRGLYKAREVMHQIVDTGLAVGTEYLDPITPQYLGDLVSWAAVGARTVESQVHRELASGLSCPVGFKNATSGNLDVAVNAICAAAQGHVFRSIARDGKVATFSSTGNPFCHVVLRGGAGGPNYSREHIERTSAKLESANVGLRVMVDASHANSAKNVDRQAEVVEEIAADIAAGNDNIAGLMIESNIKAGAQSVGKREDLEYGVSITDACIDIPTTERLLKTLAHAQQQRNSRSVISLSSEASSS